MKVSDAANTAQKILGGGMKNAMTGLSQGLKMATKGAWQFVTAALANPYQRLIGRCPLASE